MRRSVWSTLYGKWSPRVQKLRATTFAEYVVVVNERRELLYEEFLADEVEICRIGLGDFHPMLVIPCYRCPFERFVAFGEIDADGFQRFTGPSAALGFYFPADPSPAAYLGGRRGLPDLLADEEGRERTLKGCQEPHEGFHVAPHAGINC